MRTCARVLAALIAVLATLLLLIGLVALCLRVTLFNPAFIEGLLLQEGVYARVPETVVELMFEQMTREGTGEEGDPVSSEPSEGLLVAAELEEKFGRPALMEFVAALIPPAWVQEQAERNIRALFDWLNGDGDYPDLVLALGSLADRVGGQEGQEAVRNLLARLPPCGAGEEPLGDGDLFPGCRPPDAELEAALSSFLPQLTASLPGDVSLAALLEEGDVEAESLQGISGLRRAFQAFVAATWIVLAASLGLLFLAVLLAARSLDQLLIWAGLPPLAAGVLGAVGMGTLFLLGAGLLTSLLWAGAGESTASPLLVDLVASFLGDAVRGVALYGLLITGAVALVGLVTVVGGALVRAARGD